MNPFTMLLAAGAVIGAIVVVQITLAVIRSWVDKILSKRSWLFLKKNRAVCLVKEAIAKNRVRIVVGVFDRHD